MEDLMAINIVIADRSFRIKTRPQDEESIRKTAKLINDKITEFKSALAGKDMQDYVSMVLLWFAVESSNRGNSLLSENEAGKAIQNIHAMLDKTISSL